MAAIDSFETYTVLKRDTLWRISQKFGVTVDQIKQLNGLTSDTIYAGQVLKIREKPKTDPLPIAKHPIMGKNKAALKQMIDFVQAVNTHFNTMIAYHFLEISAKYGVRGDIAFCQSIHETNWFLFGGDVKPEQNNFAGIGATGGVPGHSFSTLEEGITAQMQHLFAYATADPLPQGEKQVDPRFHLVTRGSAPNWEDLSGKWAYPGYDKAKYSSLQQALLAGDTYGQRIMVLYNRMIGSRKFKPYTIEEFDTFLSSLPPLPRTVNHIQIHHTWKPTKADYQGEATIYGMWKYHTQTNEWSDIGQHFSISPDGLVWDGRALHWDPAGIAGHNKGGLMFEIIGNFDIGHEKLEGIQLEAVVHAVRACLKRFNLGPEAIVFHREHSSKSCPGTGISKDWFLSQINSTSEPAEPTDAYPPDTPTWKKEAVQWLYQEGLLTHTDWQKVIDQPLPLWAEAIVLKRLFGKLQGK